LIIKRYDCYVKMVKKFPYFEIKDKKNNLYNILEKAEIIEVMMKKFQHKERI